MKTIKEILAGSNLNLTYSFTTKKDGNKCLSPLQISKFSVGYGASKTYKDLYLGEILKKEVCKNVFYALNGCSKEEMIMDSYAFEYLLNSNEFNNDFIIDDNGELLFNFIAFVPYKDFNKLSVSFKNNLEHKKGKLFYNNIEIVIVNCCDERTKTFIINKNDINIKVFNPHNIFKEYKDSYLLEYGFNIEVNGYKNNSLSISKDYKEKYLNCYSKLFNSSLLVFDI